MNRGQQKTSPISQSALDSILADLTLKQSYNHRAIVSIMARTGLRVSDTLNLKVNDLFEAGKLKDKTVITSKKQGKPIRMLLTGSQFRHNLEEYYATTAHRFDPDSFLFKGKTTAQLSISCVDLFLKQYRGRFGLNMISSHCIRKYFITEIYNKSGFNLELCRKILNHSSVETTRKYIGINETEIDRNLELMDF